MSTPKASRGGSSSSHDLGRKPGCPAMTPASTGSALLRNSRAFRSASAARCFGRAATLTLSVRGASRVHLRAVARVETDRLHHPECRALGEDVGAGEQPLVLLDHWCCSEARGLVEVAFRGGPLVL